MKLNILFFKWIFFKFNFLKVSEIKNLASELINFKSCYQLWSVNC